MKYFLSTATQLVQVTSFADAARKCSDGDVFNVCSCGCGKLAGKPIRKVRNGKVER